MGGQMGRQMGGVNGGQNGGQIYAKIYGKIYGKFYGKTTTHLGGKIQKIVRSRERCSNFEIGFLGSHISRCVVPYWKMDDLGGVEVAGLVGGWLAGRASLKMLEPKDPIRPRWGVKKRKRFWLPPQKDLLSVGWSFRKGRLPTRPIVIHPLMSRHNSSSKIVSGPYFSR